MKTRIDTILKTSYLLDILDMDIVEARQMNPTLYFRSNADRDAFVSRCPKSLRVRPSHLGGLREKSYGLIPENGLVPTAYIRVEPTKTLHTGTSKVTGEINETGNKRLAKWYQLIRQNCRVVQSFYAQFS